MLNFYFTLIPHSESYIGNGEKNGFLLTWKNLNQNRVQDEQPSVCGLRGQERYSDKHRTGPGVVYVENQGKVTSLVSAINENMNV